MRAVVTYPFKISSKDLEAIQKRALAEGLRYQTLISSLLHKYASGPAQRGLTRSPGFPAEFRESDGSKNRRASPGEKVRSRKC